MKIKFLGTSSMLPTKERNPTAILISCIDQNILVDCGEGTQKQFRIAKISPCKITKLLITHWHGDHVLGIPGMIQSLGANNYAKTLEIYGPIGTKTRLKNLLGSIIFFKKIKFNVAEIKKDSTFYEDENIRLDAALLDHGIPCLGYSIIEKGKRKINLEYTKKFGLIQHPLLGDLQKGKTITYKGKKITPKLGTKLAQDKKVTIILDTKLTKKAEKLANNSDILIAESTWTDELKDLVEERKHLTATQAATLAKDSKSKELILTHFSQRYKIEDEFEKQAKKIFKKTITAKDFMEVQI